MVSAKDFLDQFSNLTLIEKQLEEVKQAYEGAKHSFVDITCGYFDTLSKEGKLETVIKGELYKVAGTTITIDIDKKHCNIYVQKKRYDVFVNIKRLKTAIDPVNGESYWNTYSSEEQALLKNIFKELLF